MVKVKNLKKHMEQFNEVVNGLKEGKPEMFRQVQELTAAIDTLLAKIKVSHRSDQRGTVCTSFISEAHQRGDVFLVIFFFLFSESILSLQF